jgi:hypothetical protein
VYAPPADRLVDAWHRRADTDYRFDFWTAFGWTLLSCGVYSYYVAYQLCRRVRDHNQRRLQLLEAMNELTWQRAVDAGRGDELRPGFERAAAHLDVLRRMTTDFRDPTWWLVIIIFSNGIGLLVLYVLLDQDLVKHTAAESGAEAELLALAATLGAPVPTAAGVPPTLWKGGHNYGGRIAALFGTCGIYAYWWLANLMDDGNRHFARDWAWEDAVVPTLLGGTPVGGR